MEDGLSVYWPSGLSVTPWSFVFIYSFQVWLFVQRDAVVCQAWDDKTNYMPWRTMTINKCRLVISSVSLHSPFLFPLWQQRVICIRLKTKDFIFSAEKIAPITVYFMSCVMYHYLFFSVCYRICVSFLLLLSYHLPLSLSPSLSQTHRVSLSESSLSVVFLLLSSLSVE